MAKIAKPIKRGAIAVSVPVKFIELRPSMCRWPIGDPQHFETFRFCGCACPSEAAYCNTHNAVAHASSRPVTPRNAKFQIRPPAKVA